MARKGREKEEEEEEEEKEEEEEEEEGSRVNLQQLCKGQRQ